MTALYDEAMRWLDRGVATIPLQENKKPHWRALKDVGSINGNGQGSQEPYKIRLPIESELDYWFNILQCNLGIMMGWAGYVVLDFDNLEWFMTWQGIYRPKTRMWATPRPGVHAYFKVRNIPNSIYLDGIEIKSTGTYVMAYPSVRSDGEYQLFDPSPILSLDSMEEVFPAGLLHEQKAPASQQPPARAIRQTVPPVDIWDAISNADQYYVGRDAISAIKARFTIRDFVPGPYKQQSNGTVSVHCPFKHKHTHGDQSMTAYIRDDTQSFFCPKCNGLKGWDVINVYQHLYNMNNTSAIRELARMQMGL